MDWSEEDDGRQALTPIVEMLVALAFLADCACSRSHPLRQLILAILAPAEAYARNLVIVEAQAAGFVIHGLSDPMSAGDSVADAMRMAACFRALAMMLLHLPVQPIRFSRWLTPRHMSPRHTARILLHMPSRKRLGFEIPLRC